MTLSLLDSAFALDRPAAGAWSVRQSLAVPMSPAVPAGPVSLRRLMRRYSDAGAALRALDKSSDNAWTHLARGVIVDEIRDRLRDPMIMRQAVTGLCGPISILMELARRTPGRYVRVAKELLTTGKITCGSGRVIEAEAELREESILASQMAQIDWMLAATLRDDENIWEDVDDNANGLETITFWTEQANWTSDVLGLAGDYGTCFVSGEIDCMKAAQSAVQSGGVAYFLVDANLLKDGGSDSEEDMHWQASEHAPRSVPTPLTPIVHSKDDDFPPDHWVVYVGGLKLGSDPDDDDPVSIRLWSWGREYVVTGTVDAFTEYLYGVVVGR